MEGKTATTTCNYWGPIITLSLSAITFIMQFILKAVMPALWGLG